LTVHVEFGTAIVSYIEPHAGQAREFNRWYERDHFPAAVLAGPGVYAGRRWVATRECKSLRPPTGDFFGDVQRGSYLAAAFVLPGEQATWDAWVVEQMKVLTAQGGRMFAGRDHVHSAIYRAAGESRRDPDAPGALALDRNYDGVIAVAVSTDDDRDRWNRVLASCPVTVTMARERLVLSILDPQPADHTLLLGFVEGDVLKFWRDEVVPNLAGTPALFASPFLRTIPGTDAYVDDL
jgi:hypothetical protein